MQRRRSSGRVSPLGVLVMFVGFGLYLYLDWPIWTLFVVAVVSFAASFLPLLLRRGSRG